jgi:hypothetical protein
MAPDTAYLDQITKFLTDVRTRAADGISISDLTQDVLGGMRLAMQLLDAVNGMTGEEKKAETLKLVAYLFDTYSDACVPLLARPIWWLAKPAVRSLVMSIASGAIETMLPLVRSVKC